MKAPILPPDEQARLETLRSLNLLDTSPEERFDRVTRIAKRMFGVSAALVSLVDEHRQWFKSKAGLEMDETPRDVSFCGHAILGETTFVIPDASKDDRFADNPLVLGEPKIRFYAGVPIRALNAHKLGTLCVIDQSPRELGPEDLGLLLDLASILEGQLAAVQLATEDDLTHLLNRRGFMMAAKYTLDFCSRHGLPASLAFLDLDGLKLINDTFGHMEGDRALKVLAELILSSHRDSDVLARLGGDEFVLLLTNTTRRLAEEAMSRFVRLLEKPNTDSDRGYKISFSHGIVQFDPDVHKTIEDLVNDGDRFMYILKTRSRR